MRGGVSVIESLHATPGKIRLLVAAGGWVSPNNQPSEPGPLIGLLMIIRCHPLPLRTMK